MNKKFLAFLLSICMILMLVACGDSSNVPRTEETMEINIGCMKGPTAIGMIKLLADADAGENVHQYNYTIAGTADELSTALIKEELDIAAVPCNLASVLYNKTEGKIVTVAINTLGVLYLVEAGETVQTVQDLKGKTIYSTGQGTTPEYTLRFLLTSAGLDPDRDVEIQYRSEASEVVAALKQNNEAIAMLPQPYTTVALNSDASMRIALDVTKEWEKMADSTVVTGVLVARKSFIEENEAAFAQFMEEYNASTLYANSNVEETATLLEQFDVFKADIALQAIPYCNITFITGQDMKAKAGAYLHILFEQNPVAIGGKYEEGMFYIENR